MSNYYKATDQEQMIPKGQGIVDDMELMMALSANPGIRMCRKPITPGKTSVEIHKADLYTEEKAELAERGDKKDESAPWMEFLGHGYSGHKISEVVILVPEDVARLKK
ncbi:hypothetical protein Slin15195_G071520 [Septoria linicola]|uniref:Uncharacterized protein n=1 Tax=Septoria linicola TaxID=215465 RepID=A0A9Q9AXD4_9PEZI|nr:hypothetical protein Slin14017_G104270 [Septoria linicola]USW53833.1 hypothetical protein Slin15195_G071520 [Septoria linicola]